MDYNSDYDVISDEEAAERELDAQLEAEYEAALAFGAELLAQRTEWLEEAYTSVGSFDDLFAPEPLAEVA